MSGGLSLASGGFGVPIGTFAGELTGWRGTVLDSRCALAQCSRSWAVLRLGTRHYGDHRTQVSVCAELASGVRALAVNVGPAGRDHARPSRVPRRLQLHQPAAHRPRRLSKALVPLALVGFGIGALAGTALGSRVGDRHPLATITTAVSLTASKLLVLAATASQFHDRGDAGRAW